jgi:hypothetical protein
MTYETQEALKREAWSVINDKTASVEKKAHAALYGLIQSHYERAVGHLEGAKKAFRKKVHGKNYSRYYELEIDTYIRHWLWANGACLAPEVLAKITEVWSYTPQEHELLPKGGTSYGDRPNGRN